MNVLFLERYNNYANRIIKTDRMFIEDIIADQASEGKSTFLLDNINFNPNDNITTNLIVGDTQTKTFPSWTPDYCIVYDPANMVHDDNSNKDYTPFTSCWFVIECVRTRGNQYNLSLKRDVIRDNYDTIQDADIYVEKGTVQSTDSFIFNDENLNLNQIKQSETLLKDSTGCQWLVGYVVQDQNRWPSGTERYYTSYSVPPSGAIINWSSIPATIQGYIDLTAGSAGHETNFLADYDNSVHYEVSCYLVKQIGSALFIPSDVYSHLTMENYGWTGEQPNSTGNNGYLAAARMGGYLYMDTNVNNWPGWDGVTETCSQIFNNRSYIMQEFRNEMGLDRYTYYMTLLNNYNGKVIYYGTTGKYYKINVEVVGKEIVSKTYNYNTTSNVRSRIRNCFYLGSQRDSEFWYEDTVTSSEKYFTLTSQKMTVKVTATEQGSNSVSVYLSDRRKHIIKEPYDMFCIPYGDNFQTRNFTVSKEASLAACRALAQSGLGSSGQTAIVYDIQLLPYCPLQSTIRGNSINETTLTEGEDFQYIYGPQDTKLSILFWCTESEFTFDIAHRISITDPKMENLCDVYRLCSPNYQGLFEFSAAKNGGVSFFNVDCSYKPYEPYIHINPNFNNLYGLDFNDSRGLVCGGDFSIAITTNAWEQYKLNNKNYQAIFDRGIQKMDEKYAIDQTTQTIKGYNNAIAESLAGLRVGGPAGALIGGIHGAVNASADVANRAVTHDINRTYEKDMFALQNGNVKALPNSLAKSDPFTYNNKKWPFLEKYTCTNEEKEALRKKLEFEGMTVGRIGKLRDYVNPVDIRYFKGKLIRDNFIIEDSHTVDEIYSELAKGVYL